VENTIYRDIPGHIGYRAGSDGSIWSCWRFKGGGYGRPGKQVLSDRWRRLKGSPRKEDGRLRYTLRETEGSYRRLYGAHFVLLAFVGSCPEGLECCHNDGDCTNNDVENLRWDTRESNIADRVKHFVVRVGREPKRNGPYKALLSGEFLRGERINTAKLTEAEVIVIRKRREDGELLKVLAVEFGVTATMISLVSRGKNWKHVK
jgi:hypothetical protein